MAAGPARESHVDLAMCTSPHPGDETGPGLSQERACHPVSATWLDQGWLCFTGDTVSPSNSELQEDVAGGHFLLFTCTSFCWALYLLAHEEPPLPTPGHSMEVRRGEPTPTIRSELKAALPWGSATSEDAFSAGAGTRLRQAAACGQSILTNRPPMQIPSPLLRLPSKPCCVC